MLLKRLFQNIGELEYYKIINEYYLISFENIYRYDEIALSFNGGKDSVVLIELVNQVLVNHVKVEGNETKKLRAIFFSSQNSFEEVDKFMWETANMYG